MDNTEGGKEHRIVQLGKNVSAGQKQLLTIARAMLQDAPMLILGDTDCSVE